MSTDFDAELQDLLGDVFSTFGRAATYAPPAGPASACTVIVDRADDAVTLGEGPFVAHQNIVEVRKSEIAAPAKGGVFAIGAESFRIVAAPRCSDPERLLWICLCNPL